MATEAEKPHDLPSASYEPREDGGVIQPESGGLRTRGTYGVNPSVWVGEDEMRYPNSIVRQEEKGANSSFLCLLFYSFPQWIEGGSSTLGREVCFTQPTDSNVHLTQTAPEIMFNLDTPWSVMLTQS